MWFAAPGCVCRPLCTRSFLVQMSRRKHDPYGRVIPLVSGSNCGDAVTHGTLGRFGSPEEVLTVRGCADAS